ncbi:class I SAM-dependent methyltransferase [Janibacter sp. G56]|uniref:class I SAM-dependent methyltransferase n=1 Tax=Janibacter sp. G56 TaxID=3418717 RepID=UPI003CFC1E6F
MPDHVNPTPSAALADIAPRLGRRPDIEAPSLLAHDATDRLVLAEAEGLGLGAAPGQLPADVVVIGDRHGALTLAALAGGVDHVRVHQDELTGELALAANAETLGLTGFTHHPLGADLLAGARLVLLQLPRSLDALDEIAAHVAAHAHPEVRVVAGGRLKHMSRTMNDVLARHFARIDVSLAQQKSRVLHAAEPLPTSTLDWPRTERHGDLAVVAHGGVFAGTGLDIGTRHLLTFEPQMRAADTAIDLGCGSGVLATSLALARPDSRVIATDQSSAAVASATATAAANGVGERVRVVRDNGLASQPDASADLIVLNPPFHAGAAVAPDIAPRLFEHAARVLRPGGELWCVYNSHLDHKGALAKIVGRTRQAGRNAKFTVTVSTRR